MNAKTDKVLTLIENSREGAAVAVAAYLREVDSDLGEKVMRQEAEALRRWANLFMKETSKRAK